MTQNELNAINSQISYADGQIYWEWNKGYTSKLIKRLYSLGYYAVQSGAIHILKDRQGNEITSGFSWTDLLLRVARTMR